MAFDTINSTRRTWRSFRSCARTRGSPSRSSAVALGLAAPAAEAHQPPRATWRDHRLPRRGRSARPRLPYRRCGASQALATTAPAHPGDRCRDARGDRVPPHHRRRLLPARPQAPGDRRPRGRARPLHAVRPDDDVDRALRSGRAAATTTRAGASDTRPTLDLLSTASQTREQDTGPEPEACLRCGAPMEWRHATLQCPRCRFKIGCCEGNTAECEPQER